MEHMGQDEIVQAWEQHSGRESTRLSRCIVLRQLLAHFGLEVDIQRAMPRKKLSTVGSQPVHDMLFCVHEPKIDLRLGPSGERGNEAIVAIAVPGGFVSDHHWKQVPPEKVDFELGFMDLDARLPPLVAFLEAHLLDGQSATAADWAPRRRF